jgi:carbonic anhydrase/acetyltransferase-like protein (isoleucine patch superfamily)
MALRPKPFRHRIDSSVFIAKTATVVGEVTIGKSSSVWFSAVVRGDIAPILIGEETNVQDGAVLHVGHGFPCIVGNRVTIGHGAMVHGATVKDDVMIGIGAIILNGAVIGEHSLVAAGAVVTENTVIPPDSLVMGIPGRAVRAITKEQHAYMMKAARNYVQYAKEYDSTKQTSGRRIRKKPISKKPKRRSR